MSKFIDKLSIFKKKIYSPKKSYSFGGCDLLIDYIFKSKKKGFYLDVGCQHPVSNNNTYLLYNRGWNGMNIDLDPKNIRLFNLERPNEINICKCVSSNNSKKDLFFMSKVFPFAFISYLICKFDKEYIYYCENSAYDVISDISIDRNGEWFKVSVNKIRKIIKGIDYEISA